MWKGLPGVWTHKSYTGLRFIFHHYFKFDLYITMVLTFKITCMLSPVGVVVVAAALELVTVVQTI